MIAVIEYKSCKCIFDYAHVMGMMDNEAEMLETWLDVNQKWHLLEYHLQEEFPNGTDMDEYADYVVKNAIKIFEEIC